MHIRELKGLCAHFFSAGYWYIIKVSPFIDCRVVIWLVWAALSFWRRVLSFCFLICLLRICKVDLNFRQHNFSFFCPFSCCKSYGVFVAICLFVITIFIAAFNVSRTLIFIAMKSDMWMEIDPHSGKKLHTISSEGSMSSCPATETYTRSFFIARTGKYSS